jgi:myo-inositol-1(or 4)-monophosphatase
MTATTLAQDLQFTVELARSAAKLVGQRAGKTPRLTKTHAATTAEAVTEADRASQRLIVSGLRKRFPEDGIIGEENESGDAITNDHPGAGSRVWVIDPIDGTNNFVAGLPIFAVCIGLLDAGTPVLGVVYDVARDVAYAAAKGQGAWLNNQPLQAAHTPMSDSSLLMMTSNCNDAEGRTPAYALRWMGQTQWKLRMLGSAALEAAYVAAGIAHGAVTVNGKLWDVAAVAAILSEAGAVLSDHQGRSIFPFDLRGYAGAKVPFLAAAPAAHVTLLRELQS